MLFPLLRMLCPSGFLFVTWQVPMQPFRPTQMALPPESRPSPRPSQVSEIAPSSAIPPLSLEWDCHAHLITDQFLSGPPGLARCQAQAGPSVRSEQETREIGVTHTVTGSQLISPPVTPHRESCPIDSIDRPSAPRKCLCKGSAAARATPAGSALPPRPREAPSINRAPLPPRSEGFRGIGCLHGPVARR